MIVHNAFGGIRLNGTGSSALNVILKDCNISFNSISDNGAGISITGQSNTTLHLWNVTFIGNRASTGGALYASRVALSCNQGQMTSNYAKDGGVFYLLNSSLWMTRSNFTWNTAATHGGSIYSEFCNISLFDTSFSSGVATYGAYFCGKSQNNVTVSNSSFVNGQSWNHGCAIYLSHKEGLARISFDGCVFHNNTTPAEGAGMVVWQHADLILNVTRCIFRSSSASQGAAIKLDQFALTRMFISGCLFEANKATGCGSAIWVRARRGSLIIHNSVFTRNEARVQGAVNVEIVDNNAVNFLAQECVFRSNRATSAASIAFDVWSSFHHINNSVTLDQCIFFSNDAMTKAAVLHVQNVPRVSITSSTFDGNEVTRGVASCLFTGDREATYIITNSTWLANYGRAPGVALVIDTTSINTAKLTNCEFIGNRAVQNDGILLARNTKLDLSGCTFRNNEARKIAGVSIECTSLSSFFHRIINTTFYGNRASISGESVALNATRPATLEVINSTITNLPGWVGAKSHIVVRGVANMTKVVISNLTEIDKKGAVVHQIIKVHQSSNLKVKGLRNIRDNGDFLAKVQFAASQLRKLVSGAPVNLSFNVTLPETAPDVRIYSLSPLNKSIDLSNSVAMLDQNMTLNFLDVVVRGLPGEYVIGVYALMLTTGNRHLFSFPLTILDCQDTNTQKEVTACQGN
jgi:predicted outer membrane repeat protein